MLVPRSALVTAFGASSSRRVRGVLPSLASSSSSNSRSQQQLHSGAASSDWQEEQRKRTTLYKPPASNSSMQQQSSAPSGLPQSPSLDYRRTSNVTVDDMPHRLRKSCVLFFTEDFRSLAERIAAESQGHIELGRIRWRKFADGFPDLFVEDATKIRNRHVAFLASFHTPSVIFEQISVIYGLPRLFVASFTVVLPFFPTGTLERVETEGDVATAFTLARILSNVPPSRGGPTSLVIFDIHALQERFYFGDNILPLFESGVPLLLNRVRQLPDRDNIVIAYPDDGAWKRFHYQFKGEKFEEVICTKVRDGDKRLVQIKEGNPKGRHVIIVDDLVQSGGTLLECHSVLARAGAKHVSAYVTHGVFPKFSWQKFKADAGVGAEESQGFRFFWICDSCPQTVRDVVGKAPFEVLSLAEPIAAALQI